MCNRHDKRVLGGAMMVGSSDLETISPVCLTFSYFWNEEHWIQPPDLLIISDINLGDLAFTSLSVSFLIYKMGLKMAI